MGCSVSVHSIQLVANLDPHLYDNDLLLRVSGKGEEVAVQWRRYCRVLITVLLAPSRCYVLLLCRSCVLQVGIGCTVRVPQASPTKTLPILNTHGSVYVSSISRDVPLYCAAQVVYMRFRDPTLNSPKGRLKLSHVVSTDTIVRAIHKPQKLNKRKNKNNKKIDHILFATKICLRSLRRKNIKVFVTF